MGEWNRRIPLSDQEVGFIFEELNRSKSSLPPYETLSRPTLVRWNLGEPLTVANCVVMSPQDASISQLVICIGGGDVCSCLTDRQQNTKKRSGMGNPQKSYGVRRLPMQFKDGGKKLRNG